MSALTSKEDMEAQRREGEDSPSKTAELDSTLDAIGLEIDVVSPVLVSGHLKVTPRCCQPFKVLHGGISALVSEGLSSIGAHLASGCQRVAGIQLSINHIKAARMGDHIIAEATPVQVGKTIQVWQVCLWKADSATTLRKGPMVSSARVTFLSNMAVPNDAVDAATNLMKHAKL